MPKLRNAGSTVPSERRLLFCTVKRSNARFGLKSLSRSTSVSFSFPRRTVTSALGADPLEEALMQLRNFGFGSRLKVISFTWAKEGVATAAKAAATVRVAKNEFFIVLSPFRE